MAVTDVIRGDDHLSNTPKQILIYQALGWMIPEFGHVPLIHGSDGARLSKRHGASSIEEFRDRGYLADAILNYLCLLGWSPGDDREVFSREELINIFAADRINKKNAVFDENKLKWMNGKYISQQTAKSLISLMEPHLQKDEKHEITQKESAFEKLIDLVKTRAQSIPEMYESCSFFFKDPTDYEEKGLLKYFSDEKSINYLKQLRVILNGTSLSDVDNIEQVVREQADNMGIKAGELIHPLRLALTGRTVSPGIFYVMFILGKETVLRRIESAIAFISR